MPDTSIEFQQGHKARREGKSRTVNPYGTGTPEHKRWNNGWYYLSIM